MIYLRFSAFLIILSSNAVCLGQAQAPANVKIRPEESISEEIFIRSLLAPLNAEIDAREWLDAELERRINELEQKYGLSPDQMGNLRLAGTGDIKLFFDKIESMRTEFRSVSSSPAKVIRLIRDFYGTRRSMITELFGEDSIFYKTLKNSLNNDQFATHYDEVRKVRRRRYWGLINQYLKKARRTMALTNSQTAEFMHALLEETEPPAIIPSRELEIRFLREAALASSHQPISVRTYDEEVVLLQISKLPEARLREILDDEQLRLLAERIKGIQEKEPVMRKSGYLR
ncbi:hypothetical protein [Singulisphaera sp. PoT]|uniref:hypothetical protein n=1 Tax=Singulisphaera sp. PoT TaxID=3411797 RepID=UPI003BF4FAEC